MITPARAVHSYARRRKAQAGERTRLRYLLLKPYKSQASRGLGWSFSTPGAPLPSD